MDFTLKYFNPQETFSGTNWAKKLIRFGEAQLLAIVTPSFHKIQQELFKIN